MIRVNLEKNKAYTLLRFNGEGFLVVQKFYFLCINQVFPSLVLLVLTQDKNKKFIRVSGQYLIWKCFKEINTDKVVMTLPVDNEFDKHALQYFIWEAFDPRYLIRAKMEIKESPVAELINAVSEKERLIPYCVVAQC